MIRGLPAPVRRGNIQAATQSAFGGYDHSEACRDGGIYDMKNMSCDGYPKLSTRPKRFKLASTGENIVSMLSRDGVIYFISSDENGAKLFVFDIATGEKTEKLSGLAPGKKNLMFMGGRLLIFPDMYYFRPENENEDESSGTIRESPMSFDVLGVKVPSGGSEKASVRSLTKINVSDEYDISKYVLIKLQGIDSESSYKEYFDTFKNKFQFLIGASVRLEKDGEIVVGALIENVGYVDVDGKLQIAAMIEYDAASSFDWQEASGCDIVDPVYGPHFNVAFEHRNRIWGVGDDRIHASAHSDPSNFAEATLNENSPWWADIATAGDFTAGIAYDDTPIFFKSDRIIKVYGTSPSKFNTYENETLGVERGSEDSLAVAREILFYNSRLGICAFTSSSPELISSQFGLERYSEAVGGSDGEKYFVSMKNSKGEKELFVYSPSYGAWHKEDNLDIVAMSRSDNLYAATQSGDIWALGRAEGLPEYAKSEEDFESFAEFGDFYAGSNDRKLVSKLKLRLELERGARVAVYISLDGGVYIPCGELKSRGGFESRVLPIQPKRCDRYRIKIEGIGGWKLSMLTTEFKIGSEK